MSDFEWWLQALYDRFIRSRAILACVYLFYGKRLRAIEEAGKQMRPIVYSELGPELIVALPGRFSTAAYIDAMFNAGRLTTAEATDAYKQACKGEYLIKPVYDDMQLTPYAELEQP